ncbi:ABC transporter permease [Vaginisenegalia massiliensis]|uniref:ABC transporter permease n=1 Tax=Vaginisenegalia massiliensis TaxID=2058294 RepID=UPI001F151A37|nr:ABC transporter permease subunit [Vaginisenegalia massiliensis]
MQWQRYRVFYLMLLPALVFFLIFSYWPMTGIVLAFRKFTFTSGMYGKMWVGFDYFNDFFSDREALTYVKNTLMISLIKLFVYLPFPIALALIFNEVRKPKLRSLYQSISYLPYFISWVVVVGIISRLFAPDTGFINVLMRNLHLSDGTTFWMMEDKFFYPAIFGSYLWKNIGWDSIIYFAAMMGISPSLYEAAAIDGANRWKQTRHITLPGIRGTIMILFILSLGGILTAGFDQVYLMQNPGNYAVSETIDTYIVKTGLEQAKYGPATAVGLMQGLVGLVLTVTVNKLADKYGDNAVW